MSSQANAQINATGGSTADLVARAAAGDRDAFTTLYNEHKPAVYTYLVRRTRDRALAEDLTQDVFLRALRRLDTFSGPFRGGFPAWLNVIARNIHIDHAKKGSVRLEISVSEMFDSGDVEASAEFEALDRIERLANEQRVGLAMEALTGPQRQVIALRYFSGLSVRETAARMDRSENCVRTLVYRATATMRRNLPEAEGVAA